MLAQQEKQDLIRSEEVQEILGTPPSWLTRWGSLLLLVALVILGWIGYLVRYPDVVSSRIELTSVDPPRRLMADGNVYISRIIVDNEDTVSAGQTLFVYQTSAKFEDIHVLEDRLLSVKNPGTQALLELQIPRNLILGELQELFYQFLQRQDALSLAESGQLSSMGINQVQQRIQREQGNINDGRSQIQNLETQLDLARQRLVREQNLLNARLSTADKVREREEDVLRYERLLQDARSTIKNKEFEIRMLRQEINNFRSGNATTTTQAATNLRDNYNTLRNAVEDWKKKYLLMSPIDGVIILPQDIREQQMVLRESELAIVLPLNPQGLVGRINLDIKGSGKVQEGQRTIVKFASYPFPEFGAVIGEVSRKGRIATEDKIPIEVVFPNGLITTTGRRLEAGQDMIGTAEIVTEEKRFLEWLLESFRYQ